MSSSLVGKRFGRLVVKADTGERYRDKQVVWECKCDCGNTTTSRTCSLHSGHKRSCGCLKANGGEDKKTRRNLIDITGHTFGRLTVIRYESKKWVCRCECGKEVRLKGGAIRNGNTKSCGCLLADAKRRHGMTDTPEYQVWTDMIQRCHVSGSTNYKRYGARGITVCERWRSSFEAFLEDMGTRPTPRHSIDRRDNGGNYNPANCRWATRKEQQRNTRRNRVLTYNGVSMTIAEWSEKTGLSHSTISSRLRYGWTVEKTLTTGVAGRQTINIV